MKLSHMMHLFTFLSCLNLMLIISFSSSSFAAEKDEEQYEFGVPKYYYVRPEWGFEVTTSLNAFGRRGLIPQQGSIPAYALSGAAEYQPRFIQSFGVLGIGPSFSAYPIFSGGITKTFVSLFSVGGQIRYQARYFLAQPIVPMVAYELQYLNYHFTPGPTGSLLAQGPTFGVWILLNFLEPTSAANLYIDSGVSRSYLVLEVHNLSGSDANISFSGSSYYFGLRIEM